MRRLIPRAGETNGLLEQLNTGRATFGRDEINTTFKGSFNEKDRSYSWPKGESITAPRDRPRQKPTTKGIRGGGREVRQVSFEKENFLEITKAFLTHSSVSRMISRADIPHFSRIDMTVRKEGDGSASQPAMGLATYLCLFLSFVCR